MASSNNFKETYDVKEETDNDENINDLLESALDDFEVVKEKELANESGNAKQPIFIKDEIMGDVPFDPMMNQVYEQLFKEFNSPQVNQSSNQPKTSSNQPKTSSNQTLRKSSSTQPSSTQPSSTQPSSTQPSSSQAKSSTQPSSSSQPFSNGEAFKIPEDVSKTLEEALRSLNNLNGPQQNASGSGGISEGDIAQMMAEMGMGGEMIDPGTSPEEMMPLMQTMMQNLLSKELLYTPLKEISAKYPGWIAEREGKLEETEMHRYKEQYRLMHAMVQLYEQEQTEESQQVKDQRFDKLLDLMQNMQQLGTPPKEIAGDFGGLETDEMGLPKMLNGCVPNQCSIS